MATSAGFTAFRNVYSNPEAEQYAKAFQSRADSYALLWAYYNNAIFDAAEASWQARRSAHALYRNTRAIYNPVSRLVNFYPGAIYPGVLSEDGEDLPESVELAIPFADDTPPRLKKAIAQFWQWTNFQSQKDVIVTWGAALGSVFVELVDDVVSGKVYAELVWPGYIRDLTLDSMGNVKRYVLEYRTTETITPGGYLMNPLTQSYIYTKIVDTETFTYLKDGKPFDYDGNGAVVPNPYGFVPACWIKHNDVGGIHGQPAAAGSLGKINELNSKASQIHDYLGKMVNTPFVIAGNGISLATQNDNAKRGNTDDFSPQTKDREEVKLWQFNTTTGGVTIQPLVSNLDLTGALKAIDTLIAEIEADNPEITFYQQMRSMTQVTGPAAARLSGDIIGRVARAAANYDQGLIKLFQMAVAIGGMRAGEGLAGWQNMTPQRAKFRYFNLESYRKGDLDLAIMPREIIQSTELEEALERQAYWNGITIAVGAGMPLEILLKQDGWTDAQLAELKTVKDEKVKQQQALFAQQGPVGNNPNANNNNNNNNNPPNQDNNQPMNNTDMQRQMQGRAA